MSGLGSEGHHTTVCAITLAQPCTHSDHHLRTVARKQLGVGASIKLKTQRATPPPAELPPLPLCTALMQRTSWNDHQSRS